MVFYIGIAANFFALNAVIVIVSYFLFFIFPSLGLGLFTGSNC